MKIFALMVDVTLGVIIVKGMEMIRARTPQALLWFYVVAHVMSIMIPRWTSKEAGLLVSHGVFLMLRTYLSLVVARLDGEIVRDLVAGNGKHFLWGIVKVANRMHPSNREPCPLT